MTIDVEVYGKSGCAQCNATKAKLSHYLKKHSLQDNVSLTFVDMGTPDGLAEGAFNVAFVPMFSKRVEQGDDAGLAKAEDALRRNAAELSAAQDEQLEGTHRIFRLDALGLGGHCPPAILFQIVVQAAIVLAAGIKVGQQVQ